MRININGIIRDMTEAELERLSKEHPPEIQTSEQRLDKIETVLTALVELLKKMTGQEVSV